MSPSSIGENPFWTSLLVSPLNGSWCLNKTNGCKFCLSTNSGTFMCSRKSLMVLVLFIPHAGLNEDVDRRSTSDKWLLDSCRCSILLVYLILEIIGSQRYLVTNILISCWVLVIRLRNGPDISSWFLKSRECNKEETWTSNLLDSEN